MITKNFLNNLETSLSKTIGINNAMSWPWVEKFLWFFLLEALLLFCADIPVATYVQGLDDNLPETVDFFRRITDYGKGAWYLWPTAFLVVFSFFLSRGEDVPQAYKRLFGYIGIRAFFIFSTVGLSGIAVNILKVILGRARPIMLLREGVYGFEPLSHIEFLWNSMPSGHTTTAFAVAFSLAHLYPKGNILWLFYACLLALSRVMVNAHYLSDVCAGAALGWLTVRLFLDHGIRPLARIIFPIDMRPFQE